MNENEKILKENVCTESDNLVIKVEEEEAILCEKYFYEYNGFLNLIVQFTGKNIENQIDKERYLKLVEEYIESFVMYQNFWSKLSAKYIPETYRTDEYTSELNFDSGNLIIKKVSKSCNCGQGGCSTCQK